jgi:hypothetical protein
MKRYLLINTHETSFPSFKFSHIVIKVEAGVEVQNLGGNVSTNKRDVGDYVIEPWYPCAQRTA